MLINMSSPFKAVDSSKKMSSSAKKALQFDKLVADLKVQFLLLPDSRQGSNSTYSIQDAALSAFAIFFTQCPSFLANQRQMQDTKGENNAASLFQVTKIPSDNHIRNLLDPVAPKHLTPIFELVYKNLLASGYIEAYRCINNTILIALDGVCYHSSSAIFCDKCNHKQHKNGKITYTHTAITPVIVAPGNPHVISLSPEFITPQDGHEKQDGEPAAAKRWLKEHSKVYCDLGVTFLGDDLYDCQPICQAILDEKCHFILTCKPDSHKTLYEWIRGLDTLGKVSTAIVNQRHGKKKTVDTYRYVNQVPLRDSDDALMVNWCELVTTNEQGEVLYINSFVTDHLITDVNVTDVVRAGRARWKIENENNNNLKTKGYNLEHNFGHGTQYLSQLLLAMNLLSFLFHTVMHLVDTAYQLIRAKLPTRKTFFDDLRALTRYMHFDNWQKLMLFMMQGLKLQPPNSG
jgi:hypothetical protein